LGSETDAFAVEGVVSVHVRGQVVLYENRGYGKLPQIFSSVETFLYVVVYLLAGEEVVKWEVVEFVIL
jgi:hypothetical protein